MPEEHQEEKPHASHSGGSHGGGGHDEEGHEGAPEWIISFADNVALMMGFFVILLALNMKPAGSGEGAPGGKSEGKESGGGPPPTPDLIDAVIAIRAGFNSPVDMNSTRPEDLPLVQRLRDRAGGGPAHTPGLPGSEPDVQSIRPSDHYGLGGALYFEQNSSELSAPAQEETAALLPHLLGRRSMIEPDLRPP